MAIPLDVPDCVCNSTGLPSLELYSVICDTPVEAIPVTQRSHSSRWSSLILLSCRVLRESSLFTINHAGKTQLSTSSFDLITHEPTLAFFRIEKDFVVQIVPSGLSLLDIKTLKTFSRLDSSALHLPRGRFIEKSTQGGHVHHSEPTERPSSTQSELARPIFAVSSGNILKVLCTEKTISGHDLRVVASTELEGDIVALAQIKLPSSADYVLAVAFWNSNSVSIMRIRKLKEGGPSGSYSIVHDRSLTALHDKMSYDTPSAPFCVHNLHLFFSSSDYGSADPFLHIAYGSTDGRLVIDSSRYTLATGELDGVQSSFMDDVVGGILKFVWHPMASYGCLMVNGGDGDFLYVPKSVSPTAAWHRRMLCRPTLMRRRSFMSAIHSFTAPTCALAGATASVSHRSDGGATDDMGPWSILKFIWLETSLLSTQFYPQNASDGKSEQLLLCAGSLRAGDDVSTVHIFSRCCFQFTILEMRILYEGRLVLLLWTKNGTDTTHLAASPPADGAPSVRGVSLQDATTLKVVWERQGDAVWGHPVAISSCPVPRFDEAHARLWSDAFTVVMSNASAVCYAVRIGGTAGGFRDSTVTCTELVRCAMLCSTGIFASLGGEYLLCGCNSSLSVYGWKSHDQDKTIEVRFVEESSVIYNSSKVQNCVMALTFYYNHNICRF